MPALAAKEMVRPATIGVTFASFKYSSVSHAQRMYRMGGYDNPTEF